MPNYVSLSAGNHTLQADVLMKNTSIYETIYVCDSTAGAINISLPAISAFGGFLNAKLYFVDIAGTAATNAITITCNVADLISGLASIAINQANGCIELQMVGTTRWMGVLSSGLAGVTRLKTIWVDATFGSNVTGLKYRPDRPFQTIAAAFAAAVAGDLIHVMPGTYTATAAIGKNGVDFWFDRGATYTCNVDCFIDGGAALIFDVEGFGEFTSTGGSVVLLTGASRVNFECDTAAAAGDVFNCSAGANITIRAHSSINGETNGVIIAGANTRADVYAPLILCSETCLGTVAPGLTTCVMYAEVAELRTTGNLATSNTVNNGGGLLYAIAQRYLSVQATGATVESGALAGAEAVTNLVGDIVSGGNGSIAINGLAGRFTVRGDVSGAGRVVCNGADLLKVYGDISNSTETQACVEVLLGRMEIIGRVVATGNAVTADGVNYSGGVLILNGATIKLTNLGAESIDAAAPIATYIYGLTTNKAPVANVTDTMAFAGAVRVDAAVE